MWQRKLLLTLTLSLKTKKIFLWILRWIVKTTGFILRGKSQTSPRRISMLREKADVKKWWYQLLLPGSGRLNPFSWMIGLKVNSTHPVRRTFTKIIVSSYQKDLHTRWLVFYSGWCTVPHCQDYPAILERYPLVAGLLSRRTGLPLATLWINIFGIL